VQVGDAPQFLVLHFTLRLRRTYDSWVLKI
jgi:hypothetical protein